MSGDTFLDAVPLWSLFLLTLGLMLAAHEAGFWLGHCSRPRSEDSGDTPVAGMVTAELGLLAFLLAFTFSIATSRYDVRRFVLLDEVNAVGTAYLRAEMLPEPHGAKARDLLRRYADTRIITTEGMSVEEAIRKSEGLHRELWGEAVAAAELDARSIPVGLFTQALNEVIDLHAKRVTAGLRSRIPGTVWCMLFAVSFLAFALMGYRGGLIGVRWSPAMLVVAATFAAVLWLVADLDRPGEGMLRVSQLSMVELRATMDAVRR